MDLAPGLLSPVRRVRLLHEGPFYYRKTHMTLAILIFVSLVIGLFGLYMVNKVGNYETKWGAMMVGGAVATAVLSLVSVGLFIASVL